MITTTLLVCLGSVILTKACGKSDSSESGWCIPSTCLMVSMFISFFYAEIYLSDQMRDSELEGFDWFLVNTIAVYILIHRME